MGAPNVGKSSLVQSLSSGLPEICDYPFTTRTVKMGHFFVQGQRHQVLLSLLLCQVRRVAIVLTISIYDGAYYDPGMQTSVID